jgi:putative transposase
LQERQPVEEEMEVRSAIQKIALEHRRRYGYRRITAELHRRGMPINHKRVARIMREDNLLAMQPKRFMVTTNSDHQFEIYLNLAGRMKLTGINQLWVADITYIRLKTEFVTQGAYGSKMTPLRCPGSGSRLRARRGRNRGCDCASSLG